MLSVPPRPLHPTPQPLNLSTPFSPLPPLPPPPIKVEKVAVAVRGASERAREHVLGIMAECYIPMPDEVDEFLPLFSCVVRTDGASYGDVPSEGGLEDLIPEEDLGKSARINTNKLLLS